MRSTGLEPVPVAGHAPQTCAYADSATTADEHLNYMTRGTLCQDKPERKILNPSEQTGTGKAPDNLIPGKIKGMICIRIFLFRRFSAVIVFLLLLASLICASSDEIDFYVERVGQMVSHSENAFLVYAPENGLFTVTVSDDDHVYRVIQETVPAGTSQINWDGCAYNSEKLETKYYWFDFSLSGTSGKAYNYGFRSPIVRNGQHIQFALPSGPVVYLPAADDWFIEVKTVLDGNIVFEMISQEDEKTCVSVQLPVHQGRIEHYSFTKLFSRSELDPGEYSVRLYEISKPSETVAFSITVIAELPQAEEIIPTGSIMPSENATDEQIWDIMMKPSVVVDIDYLSHQMVYTDPESKQSVGTLHGQTQCLEVFETKDGWARIGAWNHEDASYIEGWVPSDNLKKVYPNRDYGLLIDKKNQTLTVFRKGERIETLLVSTGRMEAGKYYQETSAGSFLTGLHRVDFSTQGKRYDFVIQYDGGNLLHQIPYTSDGRKDFTPGRPYLGTKASHACIRIQDIPGMMSGINAYWLWTHIPYHTRILILDDPDEREAEKTLLSGVIPDSEDDRENNPFAFSVLDDEETVLLTFTGRIIPGEKEEYFSSPASFSACVAEKGTSYPLSELKELFEKDDFTIADLGCVLQENIKGIDYSRQFTYRGLPEYAEILPSGSVEMVCMADDHLYDFGQDGFSSTVHTVEKYCEWTGNERSVIRNLNGHLFGFVSVTESEYIADLEIFNRTVADLREKGCDFVIVQCHWGKEKDVHHTILQEAMARACERAGTDLLIGHGPANVQGISMINKMPVFYSLGNLLCGESIQSKGSGSFIVQVKFFFGENSDCFRIGLIPVVSGLSEKGIVNHFRPQIAVDEERAGILSAVQNDSACRLSLFEIQ